MKSKIIFVFAALWIPQLCQAAYPSSQGEFYPFNSYQRDDYSYNSYPTQESLPPSYDREEDYQNQEIAGRDGKKDSRSVRNRDYRQDDQMRKGEYPGSQLNPKVPTSDPRWYKTRSGRQEYLKGGTDFRQSQNPSADGQDQRLQTSDPRWYKTRSGRQEYLKGGTDYRRYPEG